MNRMTLLFVLEGIAFQFISSINGFGNNLFATNLGASDFQIGLIQMVPNLIAVALLLPLGMLADRVRNIRLIPMCMIGAMTVGYLLMYVAPLSSALKMIIFFTALSFTVGGTVLYNAQWQNFFGNIVAKEDRNDILTHRNRFMFLIGIIAPVICGALLSRSDTVNEKIGMFRLFFLICCLVTIVQIFIVSCIPVAQIGKKEADGTIAIADIRDTIRMLAVNKQFLWFFLPVLLFYMAWQLDWGMWYIGQTQYLGLDESSLSIYSGIFNIGQLLAIGIFSKVVQKKGNDFSICFAGFGLAMCPLIMIVTYLMPLAWHMPALSILTTVLNAGQCTVNLCIVQILLRVVPGKGRSLAISLYTLVLTISNSFMPSVGVALYTALGADTRGFMQFFLIVAVLRLLCFGLFIVRYRYLKWIHMSD